MQNKYFLLLFNTFLTALFWEYNYYLAIERDLNQSTNSLYVIS